MRGSPNGVRAEVVNLFGILIIIEVNGSVGVGVMSRDKVSHGSSRNAQGPQDCGRRRERVKMWTLTG